MTALPNRKPAGIALIALAFFMAPGWGATEKSRYTTASGNNAEQYESPSRATSIFEKYISERLELGVRYVQVWLTDKDRKSASKKNYLGSINHLDEQQPHAPYPVVYYYFNPYLGFTLTFDRFGAITLKTESNVSTFTDGTLYVRGPVLCLRGRWPNETMFTPYAEVGAAYYRGRFKRDHEWAHTGATRIMEVDNDVAPVVAVGTDIEVRPNWHIELYGRYSEVSIDGRFYRNYRPVPRRGTFTLDHIAYGGGVKYAF